MKNNQNATIHSKFTSLFDKGWNTNTSRLRTKHADDRYYLYISKSYFYDLICFFVGHMILRIPGMVKAMIQDDSQD